MEDNFTLFKVLGTNLEWQEHFAWKNKIWHEALIVAEKGGIFRKHFLGENEYDQRERKLMPHTVPIGKHMYCAAFGKHLIVIFHWVLRSV